MSPQSRLKANPPRGEGAQRQGGFMSPQSRLKGEFPLGGKARSAKGVS